MMLRAREIRRVRSLDGAVIGVFVSVLKTLCKRAIVETAARQPILEKNRKLVHRSAPVVNGHCPFFRDVFQG